MPPAEFKPTIPASERSQTYALDRAATGIGSCKYSYLIERPAFTRLGDDGDSEGHSTIMVIEIS